MLNHDKIKKDIDEVFLMKILSFHLVKSFKNRDDMQKFIKSYKLKQIHYVHDCFVEVYIVQDKKNNLFDLAVPNDPNDFNDHVIRIEVDNLENALEELKEQGCQLLLEPQTLASCTIAMVQDNFGDKVVVMSHS